MIRKVAIKNFLSCIDTELELNDVTILIGRNAAGKSNVLKIIEWCAKVAVGRASIYQLVDYRPDTYSKCSIEFLIDKEYFQYEIKIKNLQGGMLNGGSATDNDMVQTLSLFQNSKWSVIAKKNNQHVKLFDKNITSFKANAESSLLAAIMALLPIDKINSKILKVFTYLSKINYYDFQRTEDDIPSVVTEKEYRKWLNETSNDSVTMKLIHLEKIDKELFNELQSLLNKNGLNIIEKIEISQLNLDLEPKENNLFIVRFLVSTKSVTYSQLSFGTQRVLLILLALLYDKNNSILIEQPEDGIHYGLLKKVISICLTYCRSSKKQLIIATHSAEIINLLENPENIRFVRMTIDGTKIKKLEDNLLQLIPKYLMNEGLLSEFIESMDDE
jgi:predicted ATPase